MSAKDKKSELFSYLKKAKGECRARSHTVSVNRSPQKVGRDSGVRRKFS